MVEVGTILFTAGVNLVGKLLFKWISEGKSSVKTSVIEREIAIESAAEAQRRRLRADDLQMASREALREIVERSPQLSFAKSGLSGGLRLDFNPKNPDSSKELMLALRQRVEQIEREARAAQQPEGVVLPPGARLLPAEDQRDGNRDTAAENAAPSAGTDARRMLDRLKERIERIEAERE
jgi:hypothetical protein